MDEDYSILNKKVKEANKLIIERKYKDAKIMLLDYINETKNLYSNNNEQINYSFNDIIQFYLFINIFKVDKQVLWINLMCDEAFRLLAYVSVEEKKYDEALNYLNSSLKYNPVNLASFFEIIETYKMSGNLDKMKETLDNVYDYLYNSSSLARYYRNLGFYYIEKEKYELAFCLYLISLKFEQNNFALDEMLYIRNKLNDPNFMIDNKQAIKILKENNINIGISDKNLRMLGNLVNQPKLKINNPEFINNLKKDIYRLKLKIK